jgi:sec-independent protein translocase protein TatC
MSKATAGQHLKELRNRAFIVAIFFILGACLAYSFQGPVIDAVLAPLKGEKLVYLNPAGGFSFIFMVSIYAGIALAFPILIQQLYAFLRPALPANAQKKSSGLIIGSFLLLVSGIAFGYFIAVPNALIFLYSFADAFIDASLTAESYLNFVIAYTIGIGIVFQIPLVLLLINTIKPFTPTGLMKSERWVLVGSFIVAAIITPTPDPINQSLIAAPVIVVYQIGVVIILSSIFKQRRAEKRLRKQELKAQRLSRKRGLTTAPAKKPVAHKTPTPAPVHRPVARPAMQPMVLVAQPKPQPKPMQHAQVSRPVSMDGFVIRPAQQKVVVPKRPEPQQISRPLPRPASPNQRNFTIDGMYRPFRPPITIQ